MKTAEELAKEIVDTFPALKDKPLLVEKFARMGALLEDKDEVLQGLKRLNDALDHELMTIALDRAKLGMEMKKGKYYKALKNVLEKEEGKYGFNAAEGLLSKEKIRVTLTGIVPEKEFRVLLNLGYHWKDPGAGTLHGEYAHRIQWYIFTTSSASNGSHSLELFKAMGNANCLGKIKTLDGKDEKDISMWDFLVDCFIESEKNTPKSETARAPAFVTTLIEKNEQAFPTLYTYLTSRKNKRLNFMDDQMITTDWAPILDKLPESEQNRLKDFAAFQQFASEYLYTMKYSDKFKTTAKELKDFGNVYLHPKSL